MGKCVAAVYIFEHVFVGRLHAIFHHHESLSGQLAEIVECGFVDGIRASGDNQSDDVVLIECLLIFAFQCFEWCIGVGVGLEIGQKLHVGIFA